mgnify:CR=1 FL=1
MTSMSCRLFTISRGMNKNAVIVLLALLSLGVKNIHLGPTLPAFLSPNVTKLLIENFQISGIDTVEHDMRLFFGE